MNRKYIAMLVSSVMIAGLAAGCGSTSSESETAGAADNYYRYALS